MALPLAATGQPIETPIAFPVGAETVVTYPTDEANDVTLGSYFPGLEDIAIETYGGGGEYSTTILQPATPGSEDGCIPGTPEISFPIFCTTPGLSAVFFRWLDVSSFFWYWPLGDTVEIFDPPTGQPETPVSPPCPPDETVICIPELDPLTTIGQACQPAVIEICLPATLDIITIKRRL